MYVLKQITVRLTILKFFLNKSAILSFFSLGNDNSNWHFKMLIRIFYTTQITHQSLEITCPRKGMSLLSPSCGTKRILSKWGRHENNVLSVWFLCYRIIIHKVQSSNNVYIMITLYSENETGKLQPTSIH